MTTILVCRDATEDSVLGNVALAVALTAAGQEPAIVFTGEALHALDEGTFRWSPNFGTRAMQAELIRNAERAGLKLGHRELDHRWSDVRALVTSVRDETSIRLVACPIWSELLNLKDRVPCLDRISQAEYARLMTDADNVIGGY